MGGELGGKLHGRTGGAGIVSTLNVDSPQWCFLNVSESLSGFFRVALLSSTSASQQTELFSHRWEDETIRNQTFWLPCSIAASSFCLTYSLWFHLGFHTIFSPSVCNQIHSNLLSYCILPCPQFWMWHLLIISEDSKTCLFHLMQKALLVIQLVNSVWRCRSGTCSTRYRKGVSR